MIDLLIKLIDRYHASPLYNLLL